MATHIRRDHLNVALKCHYCPKLFWSQEGWHRHTNKKHSPLPPTPAEAPPRSNTLNPLSHITELEEIRQGEQGLLGEIAPNPELGKAEKQFSTDYTETEDDAVIIDEAVPSS